MKAMLAFALGMSAFYVAWLCCGLYDNRGMSERDTEHVPADDAADAHDDTR